MGGNPPLGYDICDRKLVINQEEAKLIRHIFSRFLILRSTTNLARELNRQGHRTKRFTRKERGKEFGGNKFCIQGMRKILVNPLYLVCIRHKDQVYQGQHEGIISKEIWDRAQKIFQTNSAARGMESRTKSPALLKGILKCQPCNAAITPSYTTKKNQQRYHYYVCSHHLRGVGCPRPATYMPSHEVDEFIEKHVCTLLKAPQVSAATWLALEKKGITQEKAFEELQDIGHVWDQLHPLERNKIVQILVDVVWVRHDGLKVHFHEHGLATLLCDEPIQTLNRKQDIFR